MSVITQINELHKLRITWGFEVGVSCCVLSFELSF